MKSGFFFARKRGGTRLGRGLAALFIQRLAAQKLQPFQR